MTRPGASRAARAAVLSGPLAAAFLAAGLTAAPAHAAPASSAPASSVPASSAPAVTVAASGTVAARAGDDGVEIPLDPQAQQKTNWCWAATGTTIATYKGKSVNQHTFCNLAFGRNRTSACPNDQATLGNDQVAFKALGIAPGRYIDGRLSFSGVGAEINGDRPILTRIEWTSGGGHMMVINGYRNSDRTVEWYNPWPSEDRINIGYYDYYLDNDDFSWTHTLYGIGAR